MNLKSIADLDEGDSCDIVGVVLNYKAPKKCTKGSDYMMNVLLRDIKDLAKVISVNIFQKKIEDFPPLESNGDILLLHRIKVSLLCHCF